MYGAVAITSLQNGPRLGWRALIHALLESSRCHMLRSDALQTRRPQAYESGTGAGSEAGVCWSSRTSAFLKRYCEKVRQSAPATYVCAICR